MPSIKQMMIDSIIQCQVDIGVIKKNKTDKRLRGRGCSGQGSLSRRFLNRNINEDKEQAWHRRS